MSMPRATPKVIPIARWKSHLFSVQHFRSHGSNKQIAAEQKIAVVTVKLRGLRIFKEKRTHHRNTGSRGLLDGRIKVWHQAVAQLDVFPANGFMFRAVNPRFLIGGALGSVVAINRIERADFEPARQQIRGGRTGEAADVVSDQWHA